MDGLKEFEGKKVFIELKSRRRYSGKVKVVENDFLKLLDKYNQLVFINIAEINIISEER